MTVSPVRGSVVGSGIHGPCSKGPCSNGPCSNGPCNNTQPRWLPMLWLCVLLLPRVGLGEDTTTSLTIYSSVLPGAIPAELYVPQAGRPNYTRAIPGYAVVRHDRDMEFRHKRGLVRFTDVAARIDPTTVSFVSLSDPGARVLEQSFQYDLVSTDKLLERYLEREILVDQVLGDKSITHRGKLLSTAGGLVLMDNKGAVQVLQGYAGIRFPELPGGLITRPTLVWDVAATRTGRHRARVSYQTQGITWWADYNLVYGEGQGADTCKLDVGAWVSIINQSGADYEDARLKLVAGDVQRAPTQILRGDIMAYAAESRVPEPGFSEKSFFEYHLYTLGHNTSLPDNATKQLELFPAVHGVGCSKVLVYAPLARSLPRQAANPVTDRNYGSQAGNKVDVYLEFDNSEQHGLGIPLPGGRMRVSKLDTEDGHLEFIGEDVLVHTPRDERVRVRMGSAFDVVGERRQLGFQLDSRERWMTEQIEVILRNHKEQDVTVQIQEELYRWVNWEITDSSQPFVKQGARSINYPVTVPKHGQQTIKYTVRYSW